MPAEIEEMNRYLAETESLSFDQLRERGMFEFMLGPKPSQQDRCAEMVAWLDQFITDDLIRAYVEAAEAGQVEAFYYLDRFRLRIERPREINTSSNWTN